MGGDAVWDIGLGPPRSLGRRDPHRRHGGQVHLPLLGERRYVPFYFVGGEMDADRMARNGTDLDRYLTSTATT